tara:strand:- start:190 stop:531 length:342 start_codon:yes stop_codon:yes gene_type:complete
MDKKNIGMLCLGFIFMAASPLYAIDLGIVTSIYEVILELIIMLFKMGGFLIAVCSLGVVLYRVVKQQGELFAPIIVLVVALIIAFLPSITSKFMVSVDNEIDANVDQTFFESH